jgi:GT2 family glycosyltransferase
MATETELSAQSNTVNNPTVCIIILNWNGFSDTCACIQSLLEMNYSDYQIIIVDNGSKNQEGDRIQEIFPTIDLLKLDRNYGFTKGNNEGIAYALEKYKPSLFLLLNNDTVVETNFLSALVNVSISEDEAYATVPRINYYENKLILAQAGGKISRFTGIVNEYGKNTKNYHIDPLPKPTGFMSGCAALLKLETIKEIGLLYEPFFAYSEDTDYSLRILDAGHKIIFVPNAVVYHKESRSFKGKKGQKMKYYLATRNLILLQHKHRDKYEFPLFIVWFTIRWACYLSFKLFIMGNSKAISSIWHGYLDGIRNRAVNDF